jgi:putative phosphoesterase
MDKKIAVLSDIHGNFWALKSVLEDINNKGIKTIVNLGDSLYGPLDPDGTFHLLMSQSIISILGNEDSILTENKKNESSDETQEYVLSQLGDEALIWLKNLKKTLTLGDLFLCHGTPSSYDNYLMHKGTQQGLMIKGINEIEHEINTVQSKVILCGHSHIPKILTTPSGKLIINPGSVGCQAFEITSPFYHAVETNNPYAKYAIVSKKHKQFTIEQIYLSYNWDKASEQAKKNKRNDWAKWIKNGLV